LNDAETITLYVVEHVDDVTSSGGKRKRTLGKTNATDLVDDLVYETMTDCSTREFLFHVVPVNVVDIESEVVNAFTVLRKAQSPDGILLPPPRATLDMTADDELYNHVLSWLQRKGVGWSMINVASNGRDFVNCITAALFPLTSSMMEAMSEPHNAGGPPYFSVCL
jgi:hypothetical protein